MGIKIDTSKDNLQKDGIKVLFIEINKDYLIKDDKDIPNSERKTFLITYLLEDGSKWVLENNIIIGG